MRTLLVAIFLAASSLAHAGQTLVGVGANMNFQLSTSGREYQIATPFALRAGYRFSFMDVIGEYSYIKSSSGTDMVSIAQSNHEFLLWGRKTFALTKVIRPFGALAAGTHYQVVTTKFASKSEDDPGVFELEAAAAGGFELRFGPHISWTFEGRATTAEAYSPNPLLGLASYLNVLF